MAVGRNNQSNIHNSVTNVMLLENTNGPSRIGLWRGYFFTSYFLHMITSQYKPLY